MALCFTFAGIFLASVDLEDYKKFYKDRTTDKLYPNYCHIFKFYGQVHSETKAARTVTYKARAEIPLYGSTPGNTR